MKSYRALKQLLSLTLILATTTALPADSQAQATTAKAHNVITAKAVLGEHVALEELFGVVRSKTEAVIEGKVQGRIDELKVREGDSVSSGDLLIALSAPELNARLDRARAEQEQANRDLKRMSALLEKNAVTRQDYDAALARAQVTEGGVREATTMLSYARIEAPFSGIVSKRFIEVGDLATPGKPLLKIEATSSYRFEVDLPETMLQLAAIGSEFKIRMAGGDEIQGIVSEISPVIDPNSRTLRVKMDLPSGVRYHSGQSGTLLMPMKTAPRVIVPRSAVVERGQLEIIFQVVNQKAVLRLIRTGRILGDSIEVLSGLSGGEEVVVTSELASKLRDGDLVAVQK